MSWGIHIHAGAAVVTMNTNEVNAQNEKFFSHLHEALDRVERERPGGVVLTAEGSTFSAGIDLKFNLPLFATGDEDAIRTWFAHYRATNVRLFTFPRPTVAAINGHAIAGGLLTALCCDYRIAAASDARFAFNEVTIGVPMAAVYNEIIRYAIGTEKASVATLFGETYDVRGAKQLGLVHEIVAPERLLDAAIDRARTVPADAITAYASSKRGLQAATMANIQSLAEPLDHDLIATFADPLLLSVQRAKYQQLRGRHRPS